MDKVHGNGRYRAGCRCDVCKAAHAEAHRRYREANLDKVKAAAKARLPAQNLAARRRRKKDPDRHRAIYRAAYHQNKEKRLEYAALRWRSKSEIERKAVGWKRYGLTVEAWTAMFEAQESRCAVCQTDHPGHKRGWVVDHDHLTGKVRGILCSSCNTTIGRLGDRFIDAEATARRCLAYLKATEPTIEELHALAALSG